MIVKVLNRLIVSALLLLTFKTTFSQKQSDFNLVPVFVSNAEVRISQSGVNLLLNKLKNEIGKQGFSAEGGSRYALAADFQKVANQNNGQLLLNTYELQLNVTDLLSNKNYGSFSVKLAGAGRTEEQCMVDAVNRANFKLTDDLKGAVSEILKFTNANCSNILENARMLINADKYEAALAEIAFIPAFANMNCRNEYNRVLLTAMKGYTGYKCKLVLTEAQKEWNLKPTAAGAEKVADILRGVEINKDCEGEFNSLMAVIRKKLEKNESESRAFVRMILDNQTQLERERIAAARDIAVAYYQKAVPSNYLILR